MYPKLEINKNAVIELIRNESVVMEIYTQLLFYFSSDQEVRMFRKLSFGGEQHLKCHGLREMTQIMLSCSLDSVPRCD